MKLGERTYKNHLDGYDQLDMLTGKGPSKRKEIWYFAGPKLGAVRLENMKFQFLQQPGGWPGPKVVTDMPIIYNIRQDPFERTPLDRRPKPERFGRRLHERLLRSRILAVRAGAGQGEGAGLTAIDYPPMQDPASFNLEAVRKQIEAVIQAHSGQ